VPLRCLTRLRGSGRVRVGEFARLRRGRRHEVPRDHLDRPCAGPGHRRDAEHRGPVPPGGAPDPRGGIG